MIGFKLPRKHKNKVLGVIVITLLVGGIVAVGLLAEEFRKAYGTLDWP